MNWCEAIRDLYFSGHWRDGQDWRDTEQLKQEILTYRTDHPGAGLSAELFDKILSWKLRGQRARTEYRRVDLMSENIAVITEAALSLDHPKRDVLAALRLCVLSSMPGVSSGVASAILALSLPAKYGVVDFRVWDVIFAESKTTFTPPDYLKYLRELWACAEWLGVEPQLVDFLAWTYWETRKGGRLTTR